MWVVWIIYQLRCLFDGAANEACWLFWNVSEPKFHPLFSWNKTAWELKLAAEVECKLCCLMSACYLCKHRCDSIGRPSQASWGTLHLYVVKKSNFFLVWIFDLQKLICVAGTLFERFERSVLSVVPNKYPMESSPSECSMRKRLVGLWVQNQREGSW